MATRDSTLFDSMHVKKELAKATDEGGRMVPIRFKHTTVAGELTGDLVNLAKLPNNVMVVDFHLKRGALGASAAAGVNLQIGDVDDPVRYMVATDSDVAGTVHGLAAAGQNFLTTKEVTVQAKYTGVPNPVVGVTYEGVIIVVPTA